MFWKRQTAFDSLPEFPSWPEIESARDASFPRTDGSTGGRVPEEYAKQIWRQGWFDGRLGQPSVDHEELLRAYGEEKHRRMIVSAENEAADLARDEEVAEARLAAVATRSQRVAATKEHLLNEREQNDYEFSPIIGALYFLIAIVLLAADIPLSLKLVSQAFAMPTTLPGTGYTVGNIFDPEATHTVVTGLWEAMLLGIGIVMLGIMFKFTTDYLLGKREWTGWKAMAFTTLRVVYFLAAFLLTVGSLLCLGLLRAEERNVTDPETAAEAPMLNSAPTTAQQGIPAPQRADTSGPQVPGAAAEPPGSPAPNSWTPWAFTCLALAFPMVGGTSMALGAKRTRKWWRLAKLNLWDWFYSSRTSKETTRLKTAATRRRIVADHIGSLRTMKSSHELRIWQEMYRHGYHRGYCVPQTLAEHQSVHRWCTAMVQKWIAAGAQRQNTIRVLQAGTGRSAAS